MTDSVLGRFGRWVAGLRYEEIPEASLCAARLQVLDMIAAAVAATRSEETACVGGGLDGFTTGDGSATVIGRDHRCAPTSAALANAAYSMAQDYDDIVWMGHTCHSAVFASLAAAEHEGADARRFLTAVVAANEVAGRLGASSFLGPLNGQMWTFIHLVGAAAATSQVLDLDAVRTTNALGIALAQPNFALQPGFMTPSSKLLAAVTPTATGMQAAYFARAGMTGDPTIVEDPRGFWSRFSYLPLPSMVGDLGRFWAMQTLAVKTYPGCHYFQTAVTALERALDNLGDPPAEAVLCVHAETTKLGMEATRFAGEYASLRGTITPVNVNFDLGVTLAIRLLAGRLTSAEVEPRWLEARSAEIRELARRISVTHSPALTMRTLGSVRNLDAGRRALASIRAGDLVRLSRRYRREYRSRLFEAGELGAWLQAIGTALRGHGAERVEGSAVPLYFPSLVTVTLADGRRHEERVDLPVGSFSAPGAENEVRAKLLREVAPSLGEAGAQAVLEAGLRLGEGSLETLVGPLRGRSGTGLRC